MVSISKAFDFSASHTLSRPEWDAEKNLAVFGKCANPNGHGHNYRLEVVVAGTPDPITGMIIDTSKIGEIVECYILKDLDHRNLNSDVAWLKGIMPTTENLVNQIWERLAAQIAQHSSVVKLSKIILHETPKIYAIREE